MTSLEALFTELEADGRHQWQRTADGVVDRPAYAAWPDDLKAFYRRYAWVRLFITGPYDWHHYRFLPLTEAGPAWVALHSAAEWGPASWVAFCDVNDGQYLGLEVDSGSGRERNYIYFHPHIFALPGGSPIIARSFTELLERALRENPDGPGFFAQEGPTVYGDARPLTVENAALRVEGGDDLTADGQPVRAGWLVRFGVGGKWHEQFFADDEYGGAQEAYAAAGQMVEAAKSHADYHG